MNLCALCGLAIAVTRNFSVEASVPNTRDAMKAYFDNLTMKTWLLLVVPTLAIGYPIARVIIPVVIRAIVPDVVRNVLKVI